MRADEASEPLEQEMMGQGGGIETSSSGSGSRFGRIQSHEGKATEGPKELMLLTVTVVKGTADKHQHFDLYFAIKN